MANLGGLVCGVCRRSLIAGEQVTGFEALLLFQTWQCLAI